MTQTMNSDRPRVPVPAPIIMGLCLLVGEGIEWFLPVVQEPSRLLFVSGWVLQILAVCLLLWCFSMFLRNKTTIMPANPVSRLVIKGPYRFSRNPMYLSLAMVHLGIALSTANIWDFLTFGILIVLMRVYVIKPEESYLTLRFGKAYQDYCQQVRRWI